MPIRQTLFADAVLIGITCVWGTTFVLVQNILDRMTPLTFNAWRFLVAALFLAGWQWSVAHLRRPMPAYTIKLTISGFVLGLFLFIGYVCQTVGLLYTTASNAAFITGLSVVLVPVFSAFLLKKRPQRAAVFGVLIAAAGLYLLTAGGTLTLNRGDLIVLICAAAFALHIVFTGRFTRVCDSFSLTIVELAVVAALSFTFGLIFDGSAVIDRRLLAVDTIAVVLFMGLVATALAFLLQTVLQKKTPATHVGIIYIMEPVFAAWTSFVFQNDRLGTGEMIGCLLILLGMLVAEWPGLRRPRHIRSGMRSEQRRAQRKFRA